MPDYESTAPTMHGDGALTFWEDRVPTAHFVYVIQGASGTPYKIGHAQNVMKRIAQFQVGNPQVLHLHYVLPAPTLRKVKRLEAHLHARCGSSFVRGEWFKGPALDATLEIVRVMSQKMVEAYAEGSQEVPDFFRQLPHKWQWNPREEAELVIEEGDPLPDTYWPRISELWMDGAPYEEMADKIDTTIPKLKKTMDAMREGGYELHPGARRWRPDEYGYLKSPYGHRGFCEV